MSSQPSLTDKGAVLHWSIIENMDRDGWIRIYDYRVRKFRLVYPRDAFALCLSGLATVEQPLKYTELEQI